MPEPRYMICAEDVIVDNATNLVTFIKVIDRLLISVHPDPPQNVDPARRGWIKICAFATWSRLEEESHDQVFDFELAVLRPGHEEEIALNGQFSFEDGEEKKFDLRLQGAVVRQPGFFEVISRVRPEGQAEWQSQSFRVPVTMVAAPNEIED